MKIQQSRRLFGGKMQACKRKAPVRPNDMCHIKTEGLLRLQSIDETQTASSMLSRAVVLYDKTALPNREHLSQKAEKVI